MSERIETNRRATIPVAFLQREQSGRLWDFERAEATLRGQVVSDKESPGYPFDDTDVYKVLESAAYPLAVAADPKLLTYLDDVAAKIATA